MAALREVVTTLWWMSIGVAVLTLSHLIGTVFDVLGLDEGGFIFIRLLTTECCPFLIGSCFCAAILSRRIDLALGVGISTSSESEDMSESAGERPPPGPSPYPTFIPFVENGPTDPEPGRLRTSSVTGQDTSVGAASAVRSLYVGPSAIAQSTITPLPVYYSAPTIMAPSVRHPLFPGGFAPGYEIATAPPSSLRRSSLPRATQQSRQPPPPPPTLPQQISWLSTTRPDLVSPYFMKNMKG
ncbi:hypothetical protein DFJ73DRAFT_871966 [Zopfochytrium polystomum]|nr:hypothetical protein DFJ73DRAFT_871966 [Zopfochytrium polystomum]